MAFLSVKRTILVAVSVCTVLASVSFAINDVPNKPAAPRCIHDEIVAKQLKGMTAEAALASGKFHAATAVEVPRLRDAASATDGYSSIRIAVFTADVFDSTKYCSSTSEKRPNFLGDTVDCSDSDILTPEKQNMLVNSMIPAAVKMHEERLMVKPLSHISVSSASTAIEGCELFTVPQEVLDNGVSNADFVLFVAAAPVEGSTVAWATFCSLNGDDRPLLGVINVKPEYIDGTDQSTRVVAHEIMHALGFNGVFFSAHKMIATVSRIRGAPNVPVVDSRNVVQRAGNQFNCDMIYGMELDNTGGAGTAGSHWSVRNTRQDLMCGYIGASMKYSAITMAAMEDLGFYKPVYAKAEFMEWGFAAGCGLLRGKCVINGVSQFPSMFCADLQGVNAPMVCDADLTSLAYCPVEQFSEALPSYFQYFSDPTLGGGKDSDYCPITTGYDSAGCANGSPSLMPNSLIGSSSRCVDVASGSSLTDAICVDVRCNEASQSYTVKFLSASDFVACPPGSAVDASESSSQFAKGSTVVCPPYRSLCPANFDSLSVNVKLDGCMGNGAVNVRWVTVALLSVLAVLLTV